MIRIGIQDKQPVGKNTLSYRMVTGEGEYNREAAIRAAQNLRELPKPDASIRHELRTPLHTLMGLARLLETKLERDGQLGASDAEILHQIVLEAQRLDHLVDEIG